MKTAAEIKEAEEFYVQLDETTGFLPSVVEASVPHQLESLVDAACDGLARAIDPGTMTDIREYDGERTVWTDDRLAKSLIDWLLEKGHDDEADPNLEWFDFPEEIGLDQVLNAPVETPAELVAWLRATHSRALDGHPCTTCGQPIPYDEQTCIHDWRGKRRFHPACLPERDRFVA